MFENALIESAGRGGGSRKAVTLPLSIAIHAVIIGIARAASFCFVDDVPEPPIPVTFYAAAPPPPPPPPAAAKAPPKAPEVQKPVPIRPTEMVAPTVMPEKMPQPLAAPEPEAPAEGVEGGVVGGVPGGVVGGVLGGTGPGNGEGVVILGAIITASGNVDDVKVLKSVNPLLDAAATRAVQQWKYRPATLNGRAVRVYLTVTVTFNLH